MLFIITRLASADVIDNHVADFFGAVLLVSKILSKCSGGDFGHMFVLRDGEHLLFSQATKGYAVLERNHGSSCSSAAAATVKLDPG